MIHTFIPAPPPGWSSFSIGPFTVHMYALCILAGIFFAIWYTTKRWVERGGDSEVVGSVAFWAVPFGIIGGRLYHLITSPDQYFGEGGQPIDAFKIWNGGLGIWGAVALGAVGAYIGCRRQGVSFVTFMDAAAPAVLIAQAIGRLGNYFNQELFGRPTDVPWALHVDVEFRPGGFRGLSHVPSHVPLRTPVERAWRAAHHLLGQAVRPPRRPRVLALRDGLHLWAVVD